MIGPIGAIVAGGLINSYGQNAGAEAQLDAVNRSLEQQGKFDRRLSDLTQQYIGASSPTQFLGIPYQAQEISRMNKGSRNLAKAVRSAGASAGQSSRSGAESQAVANMAGNRALAQAVRGNRVAGQQLGMQRGMQRAGQQRGQYGVDAGLIRQDAAGAASLLPAQLAAAAHQGGWQRQLGNLAMMAGQAGLQNYMMQPVQPQQQQPINYAPMTMNL